MKLRSLVLISFALQVSAWGQAAPPEAPVPGDPLELVTGSAQPVMDAAARAALINLITRAHALANVRSSPYHMKSSFVSTTDGAWRLEDESPGRTLYRWSAQGASYSAINLNANQMHYSSQPEAAIPVRLAQVRSALFFMDLVPGPRASLRTAQANLNGTTVTCVLMERMFRGTPVGGGRRWEEHEFCIDPTTNLLMTNSPAPGMYIQYDYSAAIHFHDRVLASRFTISEAGQQVIEAKIESVTDPVPDDNALFQPVGLTEVGAGPPSMIPIHVRMGVGSGRVAGAETQPPSIDAIQAVSLHAMMSPEGKLTDMEVLASSDPSLNQRALSRVAKMGWANQVQAGATPQSYEVYFVNQICGSPGRRTVGSDYSGTRAKKGAAAHPCPLSRRRQAIVPRAAFHKFPDIYNTCAAAAARARCLEYFPCQVSVQTAAARIEHQLFMISRHFDAFLCVPALVRFAFVT